jgi:serine/threonine-protein kinase
MTLPLDQPELSSEDLTGEVLGEYLMLRRLGQGGMSHVYLAQQKSLERKVAFKILKSNLAKDESYVKRFEREAQAAAKLVQSNIVQIYEVGEIKGHHFIAQEYVPGRNLRQYLTRHGAIEPVMAINVLRQCAMALQKAGEIGVIHRDIKPENIMLSTKGEVKITDFGLARILDRRADQALTQIGMTMGTPLYMSPEQVGGHKLDHRSDIYSLGITAYQMLAGYPPFDGDNALAVAMQHINNEAVSLAKIRPDVPEELIDIIENMMSKKPENRHQDASQLLKDLRKVKIDMDDDWEMIVEKLSATDAVNFHSDTTSQSQIRLAATRQLQTVMKGNVRSGWPSLSMLFLSALLAVGAALGGTYYARAVPHKSILDVEDTDNQLIPRKQTVERQYEAARYAQLQQENYLKAVLDYFPVAEADDQNRNNTRRYHRYAKARLAELYLNEDRYSEAMPIFEEFTQAEDTEEALKVTGYAGIAISLEAMRADEFEGSTFDREQDVDEAIGKVIGRQEKLNPFILERFNTVLDRKNSDDPAPDMLLELESMFENSFLFD